MHARSILGLISSSYPTFLCETINKKKTFLNMSTENSKDHCEQDQDDNEYIENVKDHSEQHDNEYIENSKSELFDWKNASLPYSSTYLDLFLPELNLRKQPELLNPCLDLRSELVRNIDRSIRKDNKEISWKINYHSL